MRRSSHSPQAATTLPELLIAAVVIGLFFGGVFETAAICLHYISSSKENISAIECIQDRIEQLRGTSFTNVLDATYMATAPAVPAASPSPSPQQWRNLTTPANGSPLAQYGTETVKISTYAGGAATTPAVTYTRAPGAKISSNPFSDTNVTPTVSWSGGTSFPATTTTVLIDVTYAWNAALGQRSRRETSSTIISAGTKK